MGLISRVSSRTYRGSQNGRQSVQKSECQPCGRAETGRKRRRHNEFRQKTVSRNRRRSSRRQLFVRKESFTSKRRENKVTRIQNPRLHPRENLRLANASSRNARKLPKSRR